MLPIVLIVLVLDALGGALAATPRGETCRRDTSPELRQAPGLPQSEAPPSRHLLAEEVLFALGRMVTGIQGCVSTLRQAGGGVGARPRDGCWTPEEEEEDEEGGGPQAENRQHIEEIAGRQAGLRFMELSGSPILSLPEPDEEPEEREEPEEPEEQEDKHEPQG